MDVLTNKSYAKYDYKSRYESVPYYYNTWDKREIYGVGKNLVQSTEYYSHKLLVTDTLDGLALKYYNNPTYWWVIAYFNDIQDPFCRLIDKYTVLKIPSISSIVFEDRR